LAEVRVGLLQGRLKGPGKRCHKGEEVDGEAGMGEATGMQDVTLVVDGKLEWQ
jgi:hypothetical protein